MRPLTRLEVINCSFSSWHRRFKKHTLRATVLDLPPEFLAYLESDEGLFVPDGSGFQDDEPDDKDGDEHEHFSFPELDAKIREIIDDYDGAIFPKLNWSAPQDAAWIKADQTLKCRCPADVYLLLKSSDFIVHDLDHAFDGCEGDAKEVPKIQLVLKKWYDLPRSNEFRCFVKDRQLIGISARDTNYYSFIAGSASLQEHILQRILAFYKQIVGPNFPDPCYVFDIYLTRDFEKVFVVDFNVYAEQTDTLLFSWEELSAISSEEPVMRIVTSETQASQSRPRYAFNRVPKDVTQLASGQTIAEFAADWSKALAEASVSDEEASLPAGNDQNIGR